ADRLRLRCRRSSALSLRVALAPDSLGLVCARECERTARQPSKVLHRDLPQCELRRSAAADMSVLRPRDGARMTLATGGKVKQQSARRGGDESGAPSCFVSETRSHRALL